MIKQRLDKDLLIKIGNRLREVREKHGVSQENVEDTTNIKLGRYERGESNLSITTLSILCSYYGITLSEFFEGIITDTYIFKK